MFFQKIGLAGQRNAIRCGLWWAEMLKTRDQFKEAATVYFRISGEVIPLVFDNKTELYIYALLLKQQFLLGTPTTFGCNAGASILLLLVCKTTHVTQIRIPSCSFG